MKQIQEARPSGGGTDWSESEESLGVKVTRLSKIKSGRTDQAFDSILRQIIELNSHAERTRSLLREFDDSRPSRRPTKDIEYWFCMTVPRLHARAMEITVGGDCG